MVYFYLLKYICLRVVDILENSDFLLVKKSALPEIFVKVAKAKKLLLCKKAKSTSDAARQCGISRSAFYKYKDSVFLCSEGSVGKIINLSAVLEDKSGVLSKFISDLYDMKVNILTINQGMPSDGVASVTVSFRCSQDFEDLEKLLLRLKKINGVISIRQVIDESHTP